MTVCIQIVIFMALGMLPAPNAAALRHRIAADSSAPKNNRQGAVHWGGAGLTGAQLIERIANHEGVAFAIRSDPSDRKHELQLYCTSDSIDLADAKSLVETVFRMVGWQVGHSSIWMKSEHSPTLIRSDIRLQQGGIDIAQEQKKFAGGGPVGDIELESATLVESIAAVALAFDVAIVYSSGCDISTDGVSVERLSFSLEDVDLNTCLSLVSERFDLGWILLGNVVLLTPIEKAGNGISVGEASAGLRDSNESVTESQTAAIEKPPKSILNKDRNHNKADRTEVERMLHEFE